MRKFFCFILLFVSLAVHAQETREQLAQSLSKAKNDTTRLRIYNKLAVAFVGIDYDTAMSYANRSLALAKKQAEVNWVGRAYNTLASVYISLGEYDKCKSALDSAIRIGTEENDAISLGGCYITQGNYYRVTNNVDSALSSYNRALILKLAQHDSIGLGACYNSIGYCTYLNGDFKNAVDYYYRSVAIREALGDKKGLGNTYLNIAFVYVDRNEKQPALDALDKAYALFSEMGIIQSMANCCNSYGIVYMNDKDYVHAREWYSKALEMRMLMGDSAGIAENYNNVGNIYNVNNQHDSAFGYYRKAIALLTYVGPTTQVQFLSNYATSAVHLGKEDSARWALKTAEQIVTSSPRPDLKISLYGARSTFFEVLGKYDSALHYVRLMHTLSDSVYRDESTKALGEMETKYQSEKKQKEINDLITSQQQKNLQLLLLMIGAGLLLVLVAYVIYGSVQRKKTNHLLGVQNKEITEKNKDITDSITYARRIQQSVLPDEEILRANVGSAFLLYLPRDIVSGDFYWFRKEGSRLYVACADCTGHGVPGALVSVIGVNLLEQIITAQPAIATGELLDQLHRMMHTALHKDSLSKGATDGMDIAVLCIDSNSVEFSGAGRPLFRYDGSSLTQVKGDRFSIGGVKALESEIRYTTQQFPLRKGDTYYLMTDGYADQFGGPAGKKFMSKKLLQLISAQVDKPMGEQETAIEQAFRSWKGTLPQVDDVLVMGVKI